MRLRSNSLAGARRQSTKEGEGGRGINTLIDGYAEARGIPSVASFAGLPAEGERDVEAIHYLPRSIRGILVAVVESPAASELMSTGTNGSEESVSSTATATSIARVR